MTIDLQNLAELNIDDVISGQEKRECNFYCTEFKRLAEIAKKAKDAGKQKIWEVLSALTSYTFNPTSKTEVFAPWIIIKGKRSAIPSDFSEEDFKILCAILDEIADHELKARIRDVIWCEKRDYKMAIIACEDYLKSAEVLLTTGDWTYAIERIRRAVSLGASLGRKSAVRKTIVTHLEDKLDKLSSSDCGFFVFDLLELCSDYGIGNGNKLIDIADKCLQDNAVKDNWHMKQICLELLAKLQQKNGNKVAAAHHKIEQAEDYVDLAFSSIEGEKPSYMVATAHLQTAIKLLRMAGGQKGRVDELRGILLDFQEKMLGELNEFSHTIDTTELVEDTEGRVRGLSKSEAFISLITIFQLPKPEDLRKEAIEYIKKHPLQHLVTRSHLRESGKLAHQGASALSEDSEERERGIFEQMLFLAGMKFSLVASSMIEPARELINVEHKFTLEDLLFIAGKSPFVPIGHEQIFANGLFYGMRGDFLVASHLLAPQVENSIRLILEDNGVKVTSLDANGVQKELSLTTLLTEGEGKDVCPQVFGENLVFFLRWLLIEQTGPNMRNRIAHGMVNDEECFSSSAVLIWWVALLLCSAPIVPFLKKISLLP